MLARKGTPEGDRLDMLATLVEAWEARHVPINLPDPIAAIQFMMEQKGLTLRDQETVIGSRARVAEILNKRRPLTLPIIRALGPLLDLPADVLVQPYAVREVAGGKPPLV
jgi:HTH-type transcriptional regulator/antitoxin HigA